MQLTPLEQPCLVRSQLSRATEAGRPATVFSITDWRKTFLKEKKNGQIFARFKKRTFSPKCQKKTTSHPGVQPSQSHPGVQPSQSGVLSRKRSLQLQPSFTSQSRERKELQPFLQGQGQVSWLLCWSHCIEISGTIQIPLVFLDAQT